MNVTPPPFFGFSLLALWLCNLVFGITLFSVLIFNRDGFYILIILGDVCENQITLQMFLFSILKGETITTTFCV